MSFMDGCKPQGPLPVLTPEEQRVTDYYQSDAVNVERIEELTSYLRWWVQWHFADLKAR